MAREQALTVTVDEVIFRSADGHYCVLRATPEDASKALVLVGDMGSVVAGETLSVRGQMQKHPVHGDRFAVDSFTPITPRTRDGMTRYLGSGLVPGIGPALAKRLVQRFGDRTLEVITTQSARLKEVGGIGKRRAEAITEAVRSRVVEAEALSYLQSLELGPSIARRIRKQYGQDAVRVLRDDPYLVAEQVSGVGFRTADKIGRSLGYADDDPRRAAGAVMHLLGVAADRGHVFLPIGELVAQGAEVDVPEAPLRDAVHALEARGMLIVDDADVYAPPLHRAEVNAAARLAELLGPRKVPKGAAEAIRKALSTELSPDQARAVEASFEHGLLVLTGGPGTGKTTCVRALVAAHVQLGRRVLLCAPTGRAAKRLSEATSTEARTIHRLLEYNPHSGTFQRSADDPLEGDIVIVDESSMLDVWLGDALLRAVPKDCALVLVGDADQLPPVGPGPVFRELLDSGVCPVVRLQQIFRQAERSAIVRAAHDMLHGRQPTPTPAHQHGDGDLFRIRASDPDVICERLLETLERMRVAYGLDPKRDVQVLTPMRRGPLGTERLNLLLQQALNPDPTAKAGGRLRARDKVMQLKNDYDREVFNGDLGEVLDVGPESALVDMGGRRVAYDRDALDALALAYASTVHKVQGSEFPAVIVVLHSAHYLLLSRALVYTAITRGKQLVVILGEDRALGRAISNVAERRSHCRIEARLLAAAPRLIS